MTGEALLEIDDLAVEFRTDGGTVDAVDGVSFSVSSGEILGVVGESGSGKSVTAMSVLGLIRPPGRISRGRIFFRGRDLRKLHGKELRRVRGGDIAMIFQDPMTALNPVVSVGWQIVEAIRLHQPELGRKAAADRAVELLTMVGVPDPASRFGQPPHEYSGGMRQRAMIAMAIANEPALLIADEPTTALDVTIQAQVLDLLRKAQKETARSTVLITHDLGVIAELADRVVVMYAGQVVEHADVRTIFDAPRHPYTLGLMRSRPRLDEPTTALKPIPGSPPDPLHRVGGCPFRPRCEHSAGRELCVTERPALRTMGSGHTSACHFAEELASEPKVVR